MALGEDGIVEKAKLAEGKTKEEEEWANEDFRDLMEQIGSILDETQSGGTNENTTTPTPNQRKTANDLTKDNYGDYVDYGIDLDDNPETYDWRIFYIGDGTVNGETKKHIYLIAADYVPNKCAELVEAKGENKANMTKNNNDGWSECTSFWDVNTGYLIAYKCYDGHTKVSSVISDKVQCSFPELFMPIGNHCNTRYYCSDHVGTAEQNNVNSRCASALQCTENWSSFKNGIEGNPNPDAKYVDYVIGGPTIEIWVESWDEKHNDNDLDGDKRGKTLYVNGDNFSGTGYYIGEGGTNCTTFSNTLRYTTGYEDTLYFPHKQYENLRLFDTSSPDENGTAKCYGYWISSPSAAENSEGLVRVGYNGYIGLTGYYYECGVRPLVCLKSDVKLTERNNALEGSTVWDLSE